MQNRISKLALVGALCSIPGLALASSHREAPSIADDPAADNTDVYSWVTPTSHDSLTVIANYIPLEEPAGGPNFHRFSDDVLYEIHIARGNSLEDHVTYQIRFSSNRFPRVDVADLGEPPGGGKEFFSQLSGQVQTYSVWKVDAGGTRTRIANDLSVMPTNIGPSTHAFNGVTYDDAYTQTFVHTIPSGEGRVFAGPRDDGFYVDLGGVFDLANLRATGVAQDGVSGFNTHSIALEIPAGNLTTTGGVIATAADDTERDNNTVGVWASASRRKVNILRNNGRRKAYGPWVQVSRLGLPLVNEAIIGLQDKDKFNASHPRDTAAVFGDYLVNPIIVRDGEVVGVYATSGNVAPAAVKGPRTDILELISLRVFGYSTLTTTGDVLRVDLTNDSGFPVGRPIPGGNADQEGADVTDVLLSFLLTGNTSGVSDGVDNNDKDFLTEFPWLPLAHQGFDEGHGAIP